MNTKAWLLVSVFLVACHGRLPDGPARTDDPMEGAWSIGERRVFFHPSGRLDDDGLELFGGPLHGWGRVSGVLVVTPRPEDEPDATLSVHVEEIHSRCAAGNCVDLTWSNGSVALARTQADMPESYASPCVAADAGP